MIIPDPVDIYLGYGATTDEKIIVDIDLGEIIE